MSRRGQLSIDKIVALRSSVLPLYVLVQPDGTVTAADEVAEDGNDFLTTRVVGDTISFQSIRGHYLSAEGGQIGTRRYCSADERFQVERLETQYAFRSRSGQYLSVTDRAPYVCLADAPGETEMFQLFSLIVAGVNVGKQLEVLERTGAVLIDHVLDEQQLSTLRDAVATCGGADPSGAHELRCTGLAARASCFAQLAAHPVVMQLSLRALSPALRLSDVESCCTNADHVRKELEATTWHVVHPYSAVEFPGVVDERIAFTATWFLDTFDESNSTWAHVRAPASEASSDRTPRLPQLSSPEEVEAVVRDARPLLAQSGSVWLYTGAVWMSNNVGAASFWKDYDAQTRYKHLSGQKDAASQSFRALTDAQRTAPVKQELCPILVQANYVREYVAPKSQAFCSPDLFEGLAPSERADLQRLLHLT